MTRSSGYKMTKDLYVHFVRDLDLGHEVAVTSIFEVRSILGRYQRREDIEGDVESLLEMIREANAEQPAEQPVEEAA